MKKIIIIGLFITALFNKYSEPINISLDETDEKQQLQSIYENENVAYSLQNNELNITFNEGRDWLTVPIKKDQIFHGTNQMNEQQLIDHSYILTKERIAFIHWENSRVLLTYSLDQGNTWQEAVVAEPYHFFGFRKVDFLNDQFGYVLLSGERVVSQEASNFYVTMDGGENWKAINHPDTMSLVKDGGFIDDTIGFLSVGPINPDKPMLHVTEDGGNTWYEAKINVPSKYIEIFLIAEMPKKEGNHLIMFVNQGPNGDYEGGKLKGKFISEDGGLTWDFSEEIKVDEPEEG